MRITVAHEETERETYYPLPEWWIGDLDRFIANACAELDRMIREVVSAASITPAQMPVIAADKVHVYPDVTEVPEVTESREERRREWLHTHVGEPLPDELKEPPPGE